MRKPTGYQISVMAKKRQPCVVQCSFHCLIVVFTAVLVAAAVYMTQESKRFLYSHYQTTNEENTGGLDSHHQTTNEVHTGGLDSHHQTTNEEHTGGLHSHHQTTNEEPTGGLHSHHQSHHQTTNDEHTRGLHSHHQTTNEEHTRGLYSHHQTTNEKHTRGCDLFSGKWVFDNNYYPLYKDYQCPFMFDDLACEKYGRKDLNYQHWRWQPHDCDLPRFNAKGMLEKLRNKRLVFVGDSVNRNLWVSMICLLESSIPKGFKSMRLKGSFYTFKATDYNASIDFYWSPLLVESNGDDPSSHHLQDRIVRVEAIEKHARHWSNADVLVFNSYLWWRVPKIKVLSGSFGSPDAVYKEVQNRPCYKMVLKTWSEWIKKHVNRAATQLFFVSMPATHADAQEWGMRKGQNCLNETEPITREGFQGSGSDPRMMQILEAAVNKLKKRGLNINLLNITQLSEYRKDAHPSIYRKQWVKLTKQQLSNPLSYADCTHWCLPGVPDVWNQLLYAYLLRN